jgi:hypothetical protein
MGNTSQTGTFINTIKKIGHLHRWLDKRVGLGKNHHRSHGRWRRVFASPSSSFLVPFTCFDSIVLRFIIDSNRNGKRLISILWKGRLWQCRECEMGIGRPNHKIKHNDARGKLTKINKRKRRNNLHATSFLLISVQCHRRSSATILLSLTPKKTTATYCSCAATWPMFGGAWDQAPLVSKSSRTSRHRHFPLAYPRLFCVCSLLENLENLPNVKVFRHVDQPTSTTLPNIVADLTIWSHWFKKTNCQGAARGSSRNLYYQVAMSPS